MKTIITLSIVQLIVILFLLMEVMNGDGKTAATIESPVTVAPSSTLTDLREARKNTGGFDENQLRRIVREELRAQLDQFALKDVHSSGGEQASDIISEAEYQYRLDASLQNLEYYIQQGAISDAEMAELQAGIATLDQEGRRQMLSLISKALSSGELKGNF